MVARSEERTQFLKDLIITAIENDGYGWFKVRDYDPDQGTAHIKDVHEKREFDVTIETIAHGLAVIRDAKMATFTRTSCAGTEFEETVSDDALANGATGDRLYVSPDNRKRVLEASRENEAGDMDVVDALAILECGIFGHVEYC